MLIASLNILLILVSFILRFFSSKAISLDVNSSSFSLFLLYKCRTIDSVRFALLFDLYFDKLCLEPELFFRGLLRNWAIDFCRLASRS